MKDARGRLQAREIRHSGPGAPQPKVRPSRPPRAAIGLVALVALGGGFLAGLIPVPLAWMYAVANVLSYLAYRLDKGAAERGARRIAENTLHLFDALGGWPAALVAQQKFRHKTIKQPFQAIFWVTAAANVVGAWWLAASGAADAMANG